MQSPPPRVREVEGAVAAGPVSRILSALAGGTVIPLGRALLRGSSDLPGGKDAPSRHVSQANPGPSLFGLAPCGVCPAPLITKRAVRSYRTFSPLPLARRYIFCGTFRRAGLSPPSRTLSGTLLCGVRTFLSLAGATVRSGCQQVYCSSRPSSVISRRQTSRQAADEHSQLGYV